jgi:phage tail sheath protein FI
MPTVDSQIPGVYLTRIVPAPEPQLLTGVPVFLGLASVRDDVNEPKKLTLMLQFEQYFSSISNGYLADAVRGFFANGGRLCYAIALPDNQLTTLQTALETSEILEDVDLVCAPDLVTATDGERQRMQQAMLEHCDRMGDRFAILDAFFDSLHGNDVQAIAQQKQGLSSPNGALYAPWLQVENLSDAAIPKFVPPCGHVAGTYASSDRQIGVHGAPANIRLEEVLDLSVSLTPADLELLNPISGNGVNCIRSLRGRGIRAWGVRTLSNISEWKYVNVRRLFLTFRRWAERNLADTVFEANAFPLWIRLQRELSVYCESLWRQGALQGSLAQEAFYVNCDATTNPTELREIGQVTAEIGLAPTIPGEFIRLLLVQSSSGITITT